MSGQPFRARFGFDADGQKLIDLADPTQPTDAVNLRTLQVSAGMHIVARVGNLPTPSDPDPLKQPKDGTSYLVKFDLDGNPMDRIAVWDSNQKATGGVAAVDVTEPAADAAAITAAAGTSDPGNAFNAGGGTGAVLDLLANADGSITATVTAPGDDYAIGDSVTVPAASWAWSGMTGDTTITVTALTGTSPTGGWRFVDPQVWVKALRADADPAPGARPGDLTVTTERGHEELKVWDGTTWHSLFDVDSIKGWISSLNLFQGTVQEVGGTVVGALQVNALPDITTAATGVQHNSQYWVWTGQAGYNVKAGDPNGLGADLVGAVLQVGDWLQVSSRPGTNPGDPKTYHWSQIGGDLLARSRADVLYGLNGWVAGNYEAGSLVNYQGDLYRADRAVVPTDTAPGTKASAGPPVVTAAPWTKVPLSGGVKNVPIDSDLPASAPASEVYLVLSSGKAGGKAALYSYDTGSSQWVELGGGGGSRPLTLDKGDQLIGVGCPVGTIVMWASSTIPSGWLACDGGTIDTARYPELAALFADNKVPNLSGQFVRGAGTGHAMNYQNPVQWTTGRPRTDFTFGCTYDGSHNHQGLWVGQNGTGNPDGSGDSTGAGNGHSYPRQSRNIPSDGTHKHTIMMSGGGDTETAPNHVVLYYIIKASDHTVLKHPISWPPATP